MHWMLMPFRRYADFSGRSRRMEYWMFTLFYLLVIFGLLILAFAVGSPVGTDLTTIETLCLMLVGFFVLGTIIPSIAVTVRRLHDQDKSGWFYLVSFIPYVGGLILLVLMCLDGTTGSNQYGPDPKGGDADIFL